MVRTLLYMTIILALVCCGDRDKKLLQVCSCHNHIEESVLQYDAPTLMRYAPIEQLLDNLFVTMPQYVPMPVNYAEQPMPLPYHLYPFHNVERIALDGIHSPSFVIEVQRTLDDDTVALVVHFSCLHIADSAVEYIDGTFSLPFVEGGVHLPDYDME